MLEDPILPAQSTSPASTSGLSPKKCKPACNLSTFFRILQRVHHHITQILSLHQFDSLNTNLSQPHFGCKLESLTLLPSFTKLRFIQK